MRKIEFSLEIVGRRQHGNIMFTNYKMIIYLEACDLNDICLLGIIHILYNYNIVCQEEKLRTEKLV